MDVKTLDNVVHAALTTAAQPLPRLSAAVASRTDILWSTAAGPQTFHADGSTSGQVTLDSPFAFFSQTKLVTQLCGLQLLEQGLIHLDDYVEQWVPELRTLQILVGYSDDGQELYEAPTNKVTVLDLFLHTGGCVQS